MHDSIKEYEDLSISARKRLLAAVQELGAECAREAYRQGLDVAYRETARGDLDALRELLQRYGIDEVPSGYTRPDERHPVWSAFWAGAESVDVPKKSGSHADLSYAELAGEDLAGADLSYADLSCANLCDADLRGANLRGANLRYANLCDADLRGADLTDADIQDAILQDADLRGANLRGANLQGAILDGADFAGADLQRAEIDGDLGSAYNATIGRSRVRTVQES